VCGCVFVLFLSLYLSLDECLMVLFVLLSHPLSSSLCDLHPYSTHASLSLSLLLSPGAI
jgi:hypothetical protein